MKAVTSSNKALQTLKNILVGFGLLASGIATSSLMIDQAAADVAKGNRVLVVVSELDSIVAPELQPLYAAIETLTRTSLDVVIRGDYRQVVYLKNREATAERYAAVLQELAEQSGTHAIDTVMSVHGSSGRLHFDDRSVSMTTLERLVLPADMSAAKQATLRRKLRMMYNLSCFGRSHNAGFRSMGYDIVAGSNGVNANAGVEFLPTMTNWKLGGRFTDGFAPTNNDAALLAVDGPLRAAGQWQRNALADTDSKKFFAGFNTIRIDTDAR